MAFNPKKISLEEARASGVDINFDQMDNGEKRYRLIATDGSSYCRTVGSDQGAWQNSHYHKYTSELYVVQSGWIAYAKLDIDDGELDLRILREKESLIVDPYTHHNVFLSGRAVIHTIKFGETSSQPDWFTSKSLDQLTKNISEEDLVKMRHLNSN